MKVVLVGDRDNTVKDIVYDFDGKSEVTLNSFQQAAYWIVGVIREKLAEIKENEYKFSSQEYRQFSEVFEGFNEICWRDLYCDIASELEKNFERFAKNGCLEQNTLAGDHNILNEIVSNIILSEVPDIDLTISDNKYTILRIRKSYTATIYSSVNHEDELSSKRYVRYDYILTGNEVERKFFDTIRAVLIKLLSDGLCKYSTNTVCELFCEAYIDYYSIEHGSGKKNKEFEEKLRREFFWIMTETYGLFKNRYDSPLGSFISLKMIDSAGLDKYDEVASAIVEHIKERVYKE